MQHVYFFSSVDHFVSYGPAAVRSVTIFRRQSSVFFCLLFFCVWSIMTHILCFMDTDIP